MTTDTNIQDMIHEALDASLDEGGCAEAHGYSEARTYQEDSIMTNDKGLVLKMEDGSEFQITIIRSMRARP